MLNCLLSFLVLISTQETYTPEPGTPTESPSLNTIVLRLKGRLVATKIDCGMNLKEVEAVAGKDHTVVPKWDEQKLTTDGPRGATYEALFPVIYGDLGILVTMRQKFPREARVVSVVFLPLLY